MIVSSFDIYIFIFVLLFNPQVSLGFSPDEVLPGSDVSLQVQAAPGSLCGLRVVDKSVVLMKPEAELTNEKVSQLVASVFFVYYSRNIWKEYSGP